MIVLVKRFVANVQLGIIKMRKGYARVVDQLWITAVLVQALGIVLPAMKGATTMIQLTGNAMRKEVRMHVRGATLRILKTSNVPNAQR